VEDVRLDGLATPPGSAAYVPPTMAPRSTMKLFLRTAGDPMALARAAQQAIWELRPDQPISEVQSLGSVVREQTALPRFLMSLVAAFALLAAALAAVGLYGVVSQAVGRRTREIGIRMALGAGRGSVLARVVGGSLALTGAGLAAGLLGAWAAAGLLASQLYQVRPDDPAAYAAVAALVVATGLAAAWLPARRAAGVDPVRALRQE
ncbi:MAG TPA: FtsX-like permease family protein, partial [Thermoanaerobaculia bacterium]|nr:FtsX-like permease family protein [Thermoanaerobaculia bacterium]